MCWGLDRKKQDAWFGPEGVENDGTREISAGEFLRSEGMIGFERW
jgi:hypothetical protein